MKYDPYPLPSFITERYSRPELILFKIRMAQFKLQRWLRTPKTMWICGKAEAHLKLAREYIAEYSELLGEDDIREFEERDDKCALLPSTTSGHYCSRWLYSLDWMIWGQPDISLKEARARLRDVIKFLDDIQVSSAHPLDFLPEC